MTIASTPAMPALAHVGGQYTFAPPVFVALAPVAGAVTVAVASCKPVPVAETTLFVEAAVIACKSEPSVQVKVAPLTGVLSTPPVLERVSVPFLGRLFGL